MQTSSIAFEVFENLFGRPDEKNENNTNTHVLGVYISSIKKYVEITTEKIGTSIVLYVDGAQVGEISPLENKNSIEQVAYIYKSAKLPNEVLQNMIFNCLVDRIILV